MKRQLGHNTIISREVDLISSDLPYQYTEDIETFRRVLNIPHPRNSMPVSTLVMGLNAVAQKQVCRPKWLSAFVPANPSLKEPLEEFEQDFKNANLPEGKLIKPSPPKESGRR